MLTGRPPVDKFGIARFVSDAAQTVIVPPAAGPMNLRLVISVVFVGSLAYACGPRTRSDAALERSATQQGFALASMGGGGMKATKTVEKTLKSGSTPLEMKFNVMADGEDVRFELTVVNTTARNVEVNFASGQAYDFVVVDSVGREVWRWADGRYS